MNSRIFPLLILILQAIGCSAQKSQSITYNRPLYKIVNIQQKENTYIIDAEDGQNPYRIITEKKLIVNPNCEKIEIGKQYPLLIKKTFSHKWDEKYIHMEVDYFNVYGDEIRLRGVGDSLFTALNINGLCITKIN